MAWGSGYIRHNLPTKEQRVFKGDIVLPEIDDLVIHGVVTEDSGKAPLPGALIEAFARSAGGREAPLNHSYSDGHGHYLFSIDKRKIPAGTTAILVRAVAQKYSPE